MRKKRKIFTCSVCGKFNPKPSIFMSGNRFCSTCARFTLNFCDSLAKAFNFNA